MNAPPLRLAVLISGGGTTLRNLLEHILRGELAAEVRLVISSRADAPGLSFATAAGIPTFVVRTGDYPDVEQLSEAIFDGCRRADAELVVLAGFLKLLRIPDDFARRVINIHPSLIPDFCGQGYYGHHVHEAVLAAGAKHSGCTVHYVDDEYDHGPVIAQREVPVVEGDTPATLAARVFAAESELYPEVIGQLSRELRRPNKHQP